MWLLFLAGLVLIVAFVFELDEQLAGPANGRMIVGAETHDNILDGGDTFTFEVAYRPT
jgi:hypothetical protein